MTARARPRAERRSEPREWVVTNMANDYSIPLSFIHTAKMMERLVSRRVEYPPQVMMVKGLNR